MNFIGRQVASFTLLRELARGALTRVFLVSDGKGVKALKVFPVEALRQAEREFEFGSQLEHPHLNPVEALLFIENHPCILTPLLIGTRLGYWLEGATREEFLRVMKGVFSALGYMHAKTIIHRDVKPENIIVTKNKAREPSAVLCDFDLAVYSSDTARRRDAAGTVAYVSPEQAGGHAATTASDLYAAGIILYRGLTGEVPFTGSVEEVLHAHRELKPEPPSSFDKDLEPFDRLFERLLAKQPENRFKDASEVIAELENLQQLYLK